MGKGQIKNDDSSAITDGPFSSSGSSMNDAEDGGKESANAVINPEIVWKRIADIEKRLKKIFEKDIEIIKEELKVGFNEVVKNEKKELEAKIDDSKLKVIETLGIFVALFTFVSVEFQIFRSFSSWYAGASFSLIILGALTFFVLLIVDLLNKRKQKYFLLFFILPFFSIAIGLVLWKYSIIIDSNYILKEEINKNFYSKAEIDSVKEEFSSVIENNNKNKETLNCLKNS